MPETAPTPDPRQSPAPAPVVELAGATVRIRNATILRNVDLIVQGGEAVGLFGANGAGKTTLLRVVATLLPLGEGRGAVFGASLDSPARFDVRRRIGMVGHTPALYPELTLAENVALATDLGHTEMTAVEALAVVGLEGAADRAAGDCSHGMARRAEFARMLALAPDLLLLDEPHSALDSSAVSLVESMVAGTVAAGGSALIVSHDRDRVEKMATRTVELAGGTIT